MINSIVSMSLNLMINLKNVGGRKNFVFHRYDKKLRLNHQIQILLLDFFIYLDALQNMSRIKHRWTWNLIMKVDYDKKYKKIFEINYVMYVMYIKMYILIKFHGNSLIYFMEPQGISSM